MRSHQNKRPPSPGLFDKGCSGKKRYPSRRQARGFIRVMVKDHLAQLNEMTSYKCRFCQGWHVGHKHRQRAALPPAVWAGIWVSAKTRAKQKAEA